MPITRPEVVFSLVEHENGSHLGLLECAGAPRAARPYPITLLEAKPRSVGPMGPTGVRPPEPDNSFSL